MPLDLFDAFLFLCWGCILYRIHSYGMMRRYSPIAIYTVGAASALALRTAAEWRWTTASYEYAYAFAATEAGFFVATCVLLAWIYYQPSGPKLRRDWPIAAIILAALLLETLANPGAHPILRLTRLLAIVRAGFGLMAVLKAFGSSGWKIGRNLGTVLVCEFFQAGFLALSEILYVSGLLPYGTLTGFNNLAHVAAWGAIAVGLWDLDNPERRA